MDGQVKLIILDRDGVINIERSDFVKTPDEFSPIPGSLEAIALLNQHGYTVVIFTNQSGISRGLFSEHDLTSVHNYMRSLLEEKGGAVDNIWFCPHHPSVVECECRKPKTGMLLSIANFYNTSLTDVPVIGDKETDLIAAKSVKARPVLISSDDKYQQETYRSLWDAVQHIIKTDAEKNISTTGDG